jgi:predicted Zn-dependent peptidase
MKTYKITILDNELKIITDYTPQMDGACISLWLKTGSRYENSDEQGFAHLFEHLLFSGNDKYKNNFEIASAVESRGAKINGHTGRDYIFFDVKSVIEYAENAFDVLSHLVLNPLLKEEDLEKEKKIVLKEMHRTKDDNTKWATRLAYMKNFEGHPLANDPLGLDENVLGADLGKLKKYYKKAFVPEKAALIITGGLTHSRAEKFAEKYFGKWQRASNEPQKEYAQPLQRKKEISFFEKREIKETHLRFNYLIPGVKCDEDNAAIEVIANYIGNGMSTLFHQELREKNKLVYSVSSHLQIFSDAGIFSIGTSTRNVEEVVRSVKEIMGKLGQYLAKQNLDEMKIKTINLRRLQDIDDPLSVRNLGQGFILRDALFTTEDYISFIKGVTKKQSITVARKYFSPDNLLIVVLGPKEVVT